MKKLLIAAAVVCAAVFAQAATLGWGSYAFHNDGEADEDWFSGGQGYLVLVTDQSNFAVTANDGALSITGGTLLEGEGTRGAYDGGYVQGGIDGSVFGAEDSKKYTFAIIATDEGTAAGLPTSGYYGVDGFYEITWNKDYGASFDASFEHMAEVVNEISGGPVPPPPPPPPPVPEPTTYALIGVAAAALALRKRFMKK